MFRGAAASRPRRVVRRRVALRHLLKPSGRALVSIPTERGDLDPKGRDPLGRYFNGVRPGELELLFQRVGFRTIGRWEGDDGLGRDSVRWATLLFESSHAGDAESARPLDRIERVLRQDHKVATYKLALLRALSSIATTQARTVRWLGDGWVAVPLREVAELWVDYYWPLFESEDFLPQMNDEFSATRHKLRFARSLEAIIMHFRQQGGLPSFRSARAAGELDPRAAAHHRTLTRDLVTAIRTGPVKYAGRSSGRQLFEYADGHVLVEEALWQELSLMSHWIEDSLVVRWAGLSRQLAEAGGSATPQRVMEQTLRILLTPADAERETDVARNVYQQVGADRCVWSDKSITRGFDVDHVIPFRLWRSNALWNLLPAAKSVNTNKSDRLPERRLLIARRPVMLRYWSALENAYPQRFALDANRLTGQDSPDLDALFDALVESIEVTALQRGCERWAP